MDEIRILEGSDAIRVMPGMYIGGTDQEALHRAVLNLIGFAIIEASVKSDARISVTLKPGNIVQIVDNGFGIPTHLDQWTKTPIVEIALTKINAGYGIGQARPKREGTDGFNWLPLVVMQSLSERFEVEVKREGYKWKIVYSKGKRIEAFHQLEALNNPDETGTSILFQPDYSIFQSVEIDSFYLYRTLRELSFLMSELTVVFTDLSTPVNSSQEFHFENGTADFVRTLNRNLITTHEPVIIRQKVAVNAKPNLTGMLDVDIAFQYTENQNFLVLNYVNGRAVPQGGVHIDGFTDGLYNGFLEDIQILLCGLTVVISIWYAWPQFEGSFQNRLISPEVKDAIKALVFQVFDDLPPTMKDLIRGKHERNREHRDNRRFVNL